MTLAIRPSHPCNAGTLGEAGEGGGGGGGFLRERKRFVLVGVGLRFVCGGECLCVGPSFVDETGGLQYWRHPNLAWQNSRHYAVTGILCPLSPFVVGYLVDAMPSGKTPLGGRGITL